MSVPAPDWTILSAGAVALAAAFGGSLHCAAMCGPIRLLCPGKSRIGYQAGRLLAYAGLGGAAGLFGWSLPPLALLAFALAAVTLIAIPVRIPFPAVPVSFRSPFLLGLSSALLPCGLLHGWVVAAAATASPVRGALVLGALWLGTIPALELGATVLARPLARLRLRFPRGARVLILLVALAPAVWRAGTVLRGPSGTPACHHHSE